MEGYGHSKLRILGQVCYCDIAYEGYSLALWSILTRMELGGLQSIKSYARLSTYQKDDVHSYMQYDSLLSQVMAGLKPVAYPLCVPWYLWKMMLTCMTRGISTEVRLNYNSIKGRLRVGTAAMVLCAIPLDARIIILCGTEAPRVWTLARFRRWWCIEGCNLRLLEDCSELIVLKVLLSHGFLSLIGPTLRL